MGTAQPQHDLAGAGRSLAADARRRCGAAGPGSADPGRRACPSAPSIRPPNVTVRGFVPHHLVLPHMAAVISHGGLSTITAALTAGVPLVCIPQGRDQSDNAERVAASGVGRAVATGAPRPRSRVHSRSCWRTRPRCARHAASPTSSPGSAAVTLPRGRLPVWPARMHRWARTSAVRHRRARFIARAWRRRWPPGRGW